MPLFAALIVLGAWIRVPLPLVPFTLQSFSTLLVGYILPWPHAVGTVGLYLGLGLLGLPVFAKGAGGLGAFLAPTGGFLLGFLLQTLVQGLWLQKVDLGSSDLRRRRIEAGVLGTGALFASGILGLAMHKALASPGSPGEHLGFALRILAPFALPALGKMAASVWVVEEIEARRPGFLPGFRDPRGSGE